MIYIAHRGFRIDSVENTFSGFQKAVEFEMDYIELDLHESRDGVLYVIHDDKLNRTMNASGKIEEMSSTELDKVKTSSENEFLPRFSKVIEEIVMSDESHVKLMVELKGENTAEEACKIVEEYKSHDHIVFSGRRISELESAHNFLPSIPLCLNITKCKSFQLNDFYNVKENSELPLPFSMISLKSVHISSDKFIKHCHGLGITALAWDFMKHTEESFNRIKNLIAFNIDGLLFDDPRSVIATRQYLQKYL